MATIAQLEAALVKADAAGNADDARALAAEIRKMRAAQSASSSEVIAAPRGRVTLADIGDRATGFRPAREAPQLNLAQGARGLVTAAEIGAGLAAGPAAAAGIRAVSAAPFAANLARAVQSGGFAKDLSVPMRIAGGGIAGGTAAAVTQPEDVLTGAAIGAAMPGVAPVARAFAMPVAVTGKQLKEQSQAAYKAAESIKASVSPDELTSLTYRLDNALVQSGFNPVLHPKANVAVNAFVEQAKAGQPVTLNQLDVLRRVASRAAGSRSPDEQRIGSALVNEIDSFISQSIPSAAVQQIEKGRELWARLSRSKTIESIINSANRSSKEPAAAIREKFKSLAEDERQLRKFNQFSDDEKTLIKAIGKGGIDLRVLEGFGGLAPPRMSEIRTIPGMLTTAGYGGLAGYMGPTKAGTVAAMGFGSRALANKLATMRAEKLAATVRSGGPYEPRFTSEYMPQIAPVIGANMLAQE